MTFHHLLAHFFLALSNVPLSYCTKEFISSTEEYLGGFQVLAVMDIAAIKSLCSSFVWKSDILAPLVNYQGVQMLDYMARVLYLVL